MANNIEGKYGSKGLNGESTTADMPAPKKAPVIPMPVYQETTPMRKPLRSVVKDD